MDKPIVIVVGTTDTMVYALGAVELYTIHPEACVQMTPDLIHGTTHEENTFAASPLTIDEFVEHVRGTDLLRHLPATLALVRRLKEVPL